MGNCGAVSEQVVSPSGRKVRVIVIGAGAAGLSAAASLRDKSFWAKVRLPRGTRPPRLEDVEVVVLESRDRIGGRVWTERFSDGTPVDLGAAWLDGRAAGNPLVPVARKLGARLLDTDWDNSLAFEARGPESGPEPAMLQIPDTDFVKSSALFKAAWGLFKLRQGIDRQAARLAAAAGQDFADRTLAETWGGLKSAAFPGVGGLPLRQRLMMQFEMEGLCDHEYAASLEELSSAWWDVDEGFGGEQALWRDGFDQVVNHLAEGLTIHRSAPVARVSWQSADASSAGKVSVELKDGQTFEGDACVCTLPLGVLRRGAVAFDPPLPDTKRRAIGRLGFGVMDKVCLRFRKCFWEPGSKAPHVLYRVPTVESRAPASGALESPFIMNLRPVTGSNVLVFCFVTGAGRRLSKLSDEEATKVALDLLRAMFPPEVVDGAELLETKRSNWLADDWAGGCYSFLAVGSSPQDRMDLAAPCGPLHFAGEATEAEYPSTVHGALLSGRRAAKEVAAAAAAAASPQRQPF